MKDFSGKVAVVTGAASGIGRALAERFASEGMRVVLADVEETALAKTAAELQGRGATVLAVPTDVTKADAVDALARKSVERFGGVHVVCNNAGVAVAGPAWEMSLADWQWVLGVNLWGVIHGIRSFVPIMLSQGGEGHVVNTASIAGLISGPMMSVYNVTKHGVVTLLETLQHDLSMVGSRIKVSVLCPAWVNTRINESDRNRPATFGGPQAVPAQAAAMRETIGQLLASGLAPAKVAGLVFEAVRDERFYVLPHPDFKAFVRTRMQDILDERTPTMNPGGLMELRGARIAVTGATGFLGRYLVDALLARGAHVVGVVRNPDRVPALAARIELRAADLADPAALAAGFAGADAIVSNAALFSLRNRRWEDHQRANVDGTTNVFDAAADANVSRVVHVSSVAVYAAHDDAVNEDGAQLTADTPRSATNTYSISKAVSEQLAWQKAAEHGIALTTVRPCAIYGAFDPNFTAIFRRLIRLPITIMPAWLYIPVVYAGDVADGIVRALERPAAARRAYNLTGEDATMWEFAQAWRAAGGHAAWFMVPVPAPFTRRYDHGRARTELGWQNRPFVDALRETFALEAAG